MCNFFFLQQSFCQAVKPVSCLVCCLSAAALNLIGLVLPMLGHWTHLWDQPSALPLQAALALSSLTFSQLPCLFQVLACTPT